MLSYNVRSVLVHSPLIIYPNSNKSGKFQKKKKGKISVLGNYTHTCTQTSKRNSKEIMYERWKNCTEKSRSGIYLSVIYYITSSLLLVDIF